jgi:hypothetical protein
MDETAMDDPAMEVRHREAVHAAWADYGDGRAIVEIVELSAMVSTLSRCVDSRMILALR